MYGGDNMNDEYDKDIKIYIPKSQIPRVLSF